MTQIPAPQMVGLQMNVVELRNEGSTTFDMRYGPVQRLTMAPGEKQLVLEEVAWHFLGRWWMDNSNPRQRQRVEEYRRLRVLYGAYEEDAIWQQSRPQIVAYTPAGERITTVVDDPDGTTAIRSLTPLSREQQLETQIDNMSRQLQALQSQQDMLMRAQEADLQPAPLTDSIPTAPAAPSIGVTPPGPAMVDTPAGMIPVASQPVDYDAPILANGVPVTLPPRDGVMAVAPDTNVVPPPGFEIPDDQPPADAPNRVRVG